MRAVALAFVLCAACVCLAAAHTGTVEGPDGETVIVKFHDVVDASDSGSSDSDSEPDGRLLADASPLRGGRGLPAAASPAPSPSAQSRGKLTFHGGKVLQNVKVVPIFWSSAVTNQADIVTYYTAAVTSNAYYGLLSQYRTAAPAQTIGYGTVAPAYVASGLQASGLISDAAVITALKNLITRGLVPAPTANTYYPIHFPAGVSIGSSSDQSCKQWCAYHSYTLVTVSGANVPVYFGVMPDISPASCPCHAASPFTVLDSRLSIISHELFEAVTDPGVSAWYASTGDEISDLCAWKLAKTTLGDGKTYAVQKQWSNLANACAIA